MQLVEKKDNVEKVFSVCYDRKKLESLLDKIVKETSYRTEGIFTEAPGVEADFEKKIIISGASLPNGDPIYENITNICPKPPKSVFGNHDGSIQIVGIEVTSPWLAYIIRDMLSGKSDSIYDFLNYETCGELISIDEEIRLCDEYINSINNFKTEDKIYHLNKLKKLCERKRLKQYFNVELLGQYYLQAQSLIELHLESEKTYKTGNKILFKDYKIQNK